MIKLLLKITLIGIVVVIGMTNIGAQINAVTESGDQVILYDDNTWTYYGDEPIEETEIPVNETLFLKDDDSSFQLKSNRVQLGFWLNPKKWSFQKSSSNEDAEYELQLKDEDLYAMIISEKIEIPLNTLKRIAIENTKAVCPDIKLINEEYRTVNGLKVLQLELSGTIEGMKFSYLGYYYSDDSGTVQFITYTAQSLLEFYRNDAEKLLNGLTKL